MESEPILQQSHAMITLACDFPDISFILRLLTDNCLASGWPFGGNRVAIGNGPAEYTCWLHPTARMFAAHNAGVCWIA